MGCMTVPGFQKFFLPILKITSDKKERQIREIKPLVANELKLTGEQISEMFPSGNGPIYYNRIRWAVKYLKEAGLLESSKRGHINITERGMEALKKNPMNIDVNYLMQYPGFADFAQGSKTEDNNDHEDITSNVKTPEDLIEEGYEKLKQNLVQELVSQVKKCSPEFFENLVVELLVHMGYGGSLKDAGKAIGASGDGGVDGIIKEDILGLDAIYIQAKRYNDITVGRPAVQNFVGALHGKNANKGVFITTSSFSNEAKEYVRSINGIKIILVNGEQLGQFMIDHNIGVTPINSYEIKKIDLDYFQEE